MSRLASFAFSGICQSNMPTRMKSAPLLKAWGNACRGSSAPAARILKAIHGFLMPAMKLITASGSLHQELSWLPLGPVSSGRGAL